MDSRQVEKHPTSKSVIRELPKDSKCSRELSQFLTKLLASRLHLLASALNNNPRSEQALTALADLSLIVSIMKRLSSRCSIFALENTLRGMVIEASLGIREHHPGPEEWALHISGACIDSEWERCRVKKLGLRGTIIESREWALLSGPSWRKEEVAYIDYKMGESELPEVRNLTETNSTKSIYELAHIAFYSTDFGKIILDCSESKLLAKKGQKTLRTLKIIDNNWDVNTELLLAIRCLRGSWPKEVGFWSQVLAPRWSQDILVSLENIYEKFIGVYHSMAITALALFQISADIEESQTAVAS